MASDVKTIVSDPEFKSFSPEVQKQLISGADPSFNDLDAKDQDAFLAEQTKTSAPSINGSLSIVPEQVRQQIIAEQQKPTLKRLIDLGLSGPKMVYQLGKDVLGSIPEAVQGEFNIQEQAAADALTNPLTAEPKALGNRIQSSLEAAGKLGQGFLSGLQQLPSFASQQLSQAAFKGPQGLANLVTNPLETVIKQSLTPHTPSESEIESIYKNRAQQEELNKQQAIPEIFGQAEPHLTSAIKTIAPLLIGPEALPEEISAKAVSSAAKDILKSTGETLGVKSSLPPERLIRSALKPSNDVLGTSAEKAFKQSEGEIFHSNPNADKMGSMPMEGFAMALKDLDRSLGKEINDLRARSTIKISAGNNIADKLEAKAEQLSRSGQSSDVINTIKNRANDFRGKAENIDELQTAVTIANQENSPLFRRTREMSNPSRANADTIINTIIAQEGGSQINNILESLSGENGASLRKRWSNIRTIETQAEKRLNQLINSAPEEIQPAVVSVLNSLSGITGLFALAHGIKEGILPLAASASKAWSKNATKLLKDSNNQITMAYEKLRKTPPERPSSMIPPTISEVKARSQSLLDAIEASRQRAIDESNNLLRKSLMPLESGNLNPAQIERMTQEIGNRYLPTPSPSPRYFPE